jgi:hypothetical protein
MRYALYYTKARSEPWLHFHTFDITEEFVRTVLDSFHKGTKNYCSKILLLKGDEVAAEKIEKTEYELEDLKTSWYQRAAKKRNEKRNERRKRPPSPYDKSTK